ncbi:MAG: hypothetical protein JWN99_2217, partial [Ilumatobacteraceae bacterium]|nr:hypothetical protein [Ilumatobacteraceae bacterium]
ALREMLADPGALAVQGAAGRAFVQNSASPQAVAQSYARLIDDLTRSHTRRRGPRSVPDRANE